MAIASACDNAVEPTLLPTSIDTPTPNEVLITPDVTRLSRDLPSTWTPTFTPTLTLTLTPSTTYTPTLTSTPIDFELLCDDFTYTLPADGNTYRDVDEFSVLYGIGSDYSYAFVGVVFEHDAFDDVIADISVGGSSYTSSFAIADFPLAGRWNYRVGAFLIDGDDILCRQDGHFFIEERVIITDQPNIIPTALPVPSITPFMIVTETGCNVAC